MYVLTGRGVMIVHPADVGSKVGVSCWEKLPQPLNRIITIKFRIMVFREILISSIDSRLDVYE